MACANICHIPKPPSIALAPCINSPAGLQGTYNIRQVAVCSAK